MNGLIQCKVVPLETLRVEKDQEIHVLRERVARFEQSLRMTSEEADQIELRALSSEIFEAAKELDRIRSDCAIMRREYARWGMMLKNVTNDYSATATSLDDVRCQISAMAEERLLMEHCRNQLAQERALTVACRDEMAQFRDGRMGAAFREQKVQLEALQREMEGLRTERLFAAGGEASVSPCDEVGGGRLKRARCPPPSSASFEVLPGLGVCVVCRCGEPVPLPQLFAHTQVAHSDGRILICGAGCGYFVVNGSRTELERHTHSSSCRQRLAEIQRLAASSNGV
jgi:hypothetical protein